MNPIKVIVYGYNGVMGQHVADAISKNPVFELLAAVSPLSYNENHSVIQLASLIGFSEKADLIIDFSHPDNLDDLLNYASAYKVPTLIATTGHNDFQINRMATVASDYDFPILLSSNTSFGIHLMQKLVATAAQFLEDAYDIEIIEKHHNRKVDCPSGTAKTLAESVQRNLSKTTTVQNGHVGKRNANAIGIHSVRGGAIFGEHTVLFAGEEELIEIKHAALSRRVFATSALQLGKKLMSQPGNLYTQLY